MIARDEICALEENINKSGILNAALLSITSLVFNQVFHQESGVTCPTLVTPTGSSCKNDFKQGEGCYC